MRTAIFTALATGFGLGFFVAAQVGPISLLCVRSVLRGRLLTGLGIGLGAALIDITYAALGVAGVTQLLRITQVRLALGLAGAAVLLVIGARTLWTAVPDPRRAGNRRGNRLPGPGLPDLPRRDRL